MTGMTGFVSDTYTIVPQYKGSYEIKPMEFVYFDLNTKTYKTILSKPIIINVLEGPEYIAASKTNKKTGSLHSDCGLCTAALITNIINPSMNLSQAIK